MRTVIACALLAAFAAPSLEDRVASLEQRVSQLEQTGVNRVALNACLDQADAKEKGETAIFVENTKPGSPLVADPMSLVRMIAEQKKQDMDECRLRYGR